MRWRVCAQRWASADEGDPGWRRPDSTPAHQAHLRRVASTFVPAAQNTPSESEYIARSTTIWAGVLPRLSITAPYPRLADIGKSELTGTVKRLFAGMV